MIDRTKTAIPSDLIDQFIGVIDLQDGCAVHGVGGKRDQYRPVRCFRNIARIEDPINDAVTAIDGDALRLIECYRDSGIHSYYIADLNGIRHDRWQRELIRTIANSCGSRNKLYLDLGLHAELNGNDRRWIESLISAHPNLVLVAATECAPAPSLVQNLLRAVPSEQLAISFDYQDGVWMSASTGEAEWIEACCNLTLGAVIALDLAAVGSNSIERPLKLCQRLRVPLGSLQYITGGGIRRMADAQRLLESGADGLLVASLFVD